MTGVADRTSNYYGRGAFVGGENSRFLNNLRGVCERPLEEMRNGNLSLLRARARDLYNNNPLAHGAIDTIVRRVSGAGIRWYPAMRDKSGSLALEANLELNDLWDTFSEDVSCRGDNMQSLADQALLTLLRDGEVFLVECENSDKEISIEWQLIEGDQVAETAAQSDLKGFLASNVLEMGIEMTPAGRPVAYYFYDDGGDMWTRGVDRKVRRVEARFVRHWKLSYRFAAPRGIPLLVAAMLLLADDEEYRHAALVQAWVESCFGVFFSTDDRLGLEADIGLPYQDTGGTSDAVTPATSESTVSVNQGLNNLPLEPGTMYTLDDKTRVTVADPKAPSPNYGAFVSAVHRAIAAALGLSSLAVTRDLDGVSYSGGRQAENDDRVAYQAIALKMDAMILRPVYKRFTEYVYIVKRLLSAPSVLNTSAVTIQHPQSREIDPVKQMKAYAEALRLKVMSPQRICRELDGNFQETIREISEAQTFAAAHGVSLESQSMEENAGKTPIESDKEDTEDDD